VTHEPGPGGRRREGNLLVAIISGLIGILALVVSTYNVFLQQKQVRAQVWPRLLFAPSFDHSFTYDLQNGGIGPAEIRTLKILVDGKPAEDWHDAILRITGKDLKPGDWGYSTMHGSLAIAGSSRHVLTVHDDSIGHSMFREQGRLRAEICYCSALDECWLLVDNLPRGVAKCPDYGKQEFGD
jgi:hypothetical protein